MSKTTLISEMQKFRFGSTIICSDGEEGTLAHLMFDAATRRLRYIGVKQGRLFGKIVSLPYDTVVDATSEGITLSIKRADVASATNLGIDGVQLDGKSTIENPPTSAKGTLMLMAVHPESGELAYLVAHNLRPGQDTLLQQEFITELAFARVIVNVPEITLNAFPPYRPDDVLQQEVEAILYDITPLHVDLKGMTVRVLDSVLYLDGNISSSLRGDIARDQVSGVLGLLEIKNRLVGDDKLAGDLAMALGRDPRTRDLPIGIYPRLGIVRLGGAVHNSQQKAVAEEIARSFDGVRTVVNELVVNPKAELLYVMSPAEGGEAEDKVPGKYIRHTK